MHMLSHAEASEKFIANRERTDWHDDTLWFVRAKRDKASKLLPEWEALRDQASQIKEHMLSNLPQYLLEFKQKHKLMVFRFIGLRMHRSIMK